MNEFEAKCYGMSQADIRSQYMESITAQMSGMEFVVAGILSDVQEMMAYDHKAQVNIDASKNMVRKQLNIAKFILFEMLEAKRKETV